MTECKGGRSCYLVSNFWPIDVFTVSLSRARSKLFYLYQEYTHHQSARRLYQVPYQWLSLAKLCSGETRLVQLNLGRGRFLHLWKTLPLAPSAAAGYVDDNRTQPIAAFWRTSLHTVNGERGKPQEVSLLQDQERDIVTLHEVSIQSSLPLEHADHVRCYEHR